MEFCVDENKIELGQDASIKSKSLSIEDYQKLMSKYQKASSSENEQERGSNILCDTELFSVAKEMIEKYCYELDGITLVEKGEKRNATIQDIFNIGAFIVIVIKIINGLISSSMLSAEEETQVKK